MEHAKPIKTIIIAEAGVNHNGKIELAFQLIDAAVEAGVDAVKFQTFKTELLVNKTAERASYQKQNMPHRQESQQEMIRKLELSYESFQKLKKYCDKKGILFLTTTYEIPSTERIFKLVPAFKVGSSDLTNIPFLQYLALKNKPIILSTGMSTLSMVERAISTLQNNVVKTKSIFPPLTLLHCTTNYPCPYNEVNLRAMVTLREAFKLPVGYSDHTLGIEVPVAAVALGASMIEKHFTLDRTMEGPDHKASLEPSELKAMVGAFDIHCTVQ